VHDDKSHFGTQNLSCQLELPEVETLLLNIQMDAIKHLLLPALETL
jgi:hypothetical protein